MTLLRLRAERRQVPALLASKPLGVTEKLLALRQRRRLDESLSLLSGLGATR
jgi:hypothetical protein